MKSRGLGDSIEKFTKATGIKRVADMIPGGCGCDDRKQWFNKNGNKTKKNKNLYSSRF